MNPQVDRWFEEADRPLAPLLQRVREIILGADDRVTESIKWKTPTFAYKGNIVSFNPAKHFVSLLFHRGAEIRATIRGSRATAGSPARCASPTPIRSRPAGRSSRPSSAPGATPGTPDGAGA